MKLRIEKLTQNKIQECVDVYIDTFTKEPWNDIYESREQVISFFQNHLNNNYFVGYVGMIQDKIVALSVGMKKAWINGMEYYIDEFCVLNDYQGKGIGTLFLKEITANIEKDGLNAIILNTEKDYPSEKFYLKNGFQIKKDLIILTR